jgi:carboxylate-amine ligase
MESIAFTRSAPYTLGVELEFQVVDQETLDLVPMAEILLAEMDKRFVGRTAREFRKSILEVLTGVCRDVDEVADDLRHTINAVEKLARGEGCLLLASSLHPFANPNDQELADSERYHRIMEELQLVGRQFITQGLHVHVGMDDKEQAIRVCDTMQAYQPLLLALSASSPFFKGEDTGFSSYRTKLFESLPLAGIAGFIGSWRAYEEEINLLKASEVIKEIRDLWWDVRPSPGFGTVEIRGCDLPGCLSEILAMVALIQVLAAELSEGNSPHRQVSPQLLRCNKWQAARHGLEGRFTDPLGLLSVATQPIRKAILQLLDLLQPRFVSFGTEQYLATLHTILKKGSSSDRQRELYRKNGSFQGMITRLHDEFWT